MCFQRGNFWNICAAVMKAKSEVRQKICSNERSLIYEAAGFCS